MWGSLIINHEATKDTKDTKKSAVPDASYPILENFNVEVYE
jgi:hypothetical protein